MNGFCDHIQPWQIESSGGDRNRCLFCILKEVSIEPIAVVQIGLERLLM